MSDFHLDNVTHLSEIPPGARIHFVAVGGVAMAPLAIALSKRGYRVTGSDKEFYEPMASVLSNSSVICMKGFDSKHITSDIALTVIGNAASRENPEVLAIKEGKVRYTSQAQLLADLIVVGKSPLVVSGTHGKSTTTALAASIFEHSSTAPSYFIGAQPIGLPSSLEVQSGDFSIIEGDEYDTAFFAKVPKFSFYAPKILIITSIEYDHADIYPSLEAIEEQFTKLVSSLNKDATAIVCIDNQNVRRLLPIWRAGSKAQIITYGRSADAEYRLQKTIQEGLSQRFSFVDSRGQVHEGVLPMIGEYNAINGVAALAAGIAAGIKMPTLLRMAAEYKGIRRRQEVRYNKDGTVIIDDFAHHPTAVRETIVGIRAAFPDSKIVAVFEPRSTSSRRPIFFNDYLNALKSADEIVLSIPKAREKDAGLELLNVSEIALQLKKLGHKATALNGGSEIANYLKSSGIISDNKATPTVVLVMSNGDFDGLVNTLCGMMGAWSIN